MNNINLDSIRVGGAPLGVGDETAVQQQMPAEKKILSGPAVTVSRSFDTLVDWLAREVEKSYDGQARTRLSLAVSTLTARAEIASKAQLEILENCEEYIDKIAADQKTLEGEKAERTRLEEEIAKAKDRVSASTAESAESTESADSSEAVADSSVAVAEGPSLQELEEQLAKCNERIGKLEKNISENSKLLDAELAKLDDKSSRVLAAAVRVSSSESASYLEVLRNLGEDEGKYGKLSAIDAFNRLLSGEDMDKVLLEELGIRG